MEHIAKMPKTATFRMRMDPVTKKEAEQLFASCGMTLTDAINIFLRQSINTGGLPFHVTRNGGRSGSPNNFREQKRMG